MYKARSTNEYMHARGRQVDVSRLLKLGLISVLFVFSASLLPLKAYSQCAATGDIPFIVTNDATRGTAGVSPDFCLLCTGPWLRSSGNFHVPEGLKDCEFYAAKRSAPFSPFGQWTCRLAWVDFSGLCHQIPPFKDPFDTVDFCLDLFDDMIAIDITGKFDFDTNEEPKLNIQALSPPCSSTTQSFLGDNPKQEKSKPDTDTFTFNGTEGDEVLISLDPDAKAGHNGGEATLGLSGVSLSQVTAGPLPLEIQATLPETAEYSIEVRQPKIPVEERFRGSYNLRVDPSITSVIIIEPTNNVEK